MKFLLPILLLLSAFCRADDFTQANQAYGAGKFDEALAGYKKILQNGDYANAWFNSGNALFRQDKLGPAALAYERALLAQPNHPEAAANLKFVRNKANARVAEAPWLEKAWRYVAQPAASWLLIAEAWLGLALIAAVLLGRKSRAALILGVLLAFLGAGGVAALQFARGELANLAVTLNGVDARTEPADRGGLAETLGAASRVQVISAQGDWTYCSLPGGGRGWIPTKSIERIVAAARL
jgi:tetratricopeptide (TPR) repeat protein